MQLPVRHSRRPNAKASLYGLAAGAGWGLFTAVSATPPEWPVYDPNTGLIYKYLDGGLLTTTIEAGRFWADLQTGLVQITLILLALVGPAGWATWQLSRIRARGEVQPPLGAGLDWYLIGLALGGLLVVGLFRLLGLDLWVRGAILTPGRAVIAILEILLPVYMGASLFLVWFLRLKSIRPPNWETYYPRPSQSSTGFFRKWYRAWKGGDSVKE